MSDYSERFGGLARLFGPAGAERLRAAHVAVIGLGGVGSWTVECLARSGIGALTLVDLDDICITNVNRQLHALDGALGRSKAEALAERVRAIAPECRVHLIQEFFGEDNADAILGTKFDFVVDAIDRRSTKCLLIAACVQRGIPVLTCGAAGGRRDPTRLRCVDLARAEHDELLRQVRKKLRRDHGFPRGEKSRFGVPCVHSEETPMFPWSDGRICPTPEPGASLRLDCASGFGTASFATGAFGLAAAAEVVRRIAESPASSGGS